MALTGWSFLSYSLSARSFWMVLTGWTVLFPFPHSSPVPRARPLPHLCQERVPFITCAKSASPSSPVPSAFLTCAKSASPSSPVPRARPLPHLCQARPLPHLCQARVPFLTCAKSASPSSPVPSASPSKEIWEGRGQGCLLRMKQGCPQSRLWQKRARTVADSRSDPVRAFEQYLLCAYLCPVKDAIARL